MPGPWRCGFCPYRAKQRHTAQEQAFSEAQIYYRYDPRAGTAVSVVGRTKVGDDNFLMVRQSDGTNAHIPLWMTLPGAADLTMHLPPRISLEALQGLRRSLDAALSLLAGATTDPGGKDETQQRRGATRPIQRSVGAADGAHIESMSRRSRGITGSIALGSGTQPADTSAPRRGKS